MKTQFFTIALATLMVGILFTSCESAEQREAAANAEVKEAQEDLREAKQDATFAAQKSANAEEWRIFKADIDEEITKNENRIAELKIQLKNSGKNLDEAYAERIDALEQQNKNLKTRMVTFERNQSDWESFKREFNRDMDKLGKELNNLTIDNQN